ncbi:hypothetical protein ACHWQZ_G010555 [Mnemiopsis leidyi]
MWLAWIKQEKLFLPLDRERVRDTLRNLYSRAVKDYSCIRLWCEYCNDVVTDLEYSEDRIREIFELALSNIGLHVTKGGELWEQFRQYEETLLQTIREQLDKEDCPEKEFVQDLYNKQRSRVDSLYQRQLAVPLTGLEYTMSEYKTWLGEGVGIPVALLTRYEAALKKREAIISFEQALEISAAPHEEEYLHYIEYERKHGDPARVICLMERAITDNPLNSNRWVDYLQYLDQVLKVKTVVLSTYGRAVRNVPWIVDIWTQFMLAQQRYQLHFSHVDETLDEALKNGFQDAASYLSLWKCYLSCHWRQERFQPLKTNGSEEHLENNPLNSAFERSINFMNQTFGEEGDPTGELTRFMAECEGVRDDVNSFRVLMSGLFESKIYKEQSSLWLEYISMELRFGEVSEARKIYQKAVQCSTDSPQLIIQQFLNFESVHGTLETYDNAALKCRRQQKKINEKSAKEAEKLALQNKKHSDNKGKNKQTSKDGPGKSKTEPKDKNDKHAPSKKRKISSEPENQKDAKVVKPSNKSPEKPSFPKKPVQESAEIDKSKYPLTVFVSNLSYDATEDDLNETFKHIGSIVDIRLVKSVNNKSRGFGYIEFHTREEVMSALELDRVPVLGRPCYVSECQEKSLGSKTEFKYKNTIENHKLFVNNLPYTTTEAELRDMFGKISDIKSLRMVTTKSGKFKGFAYVEYRDSESAKKAILELNDTQVGDRKMSVAISNPPGKTSSQRHNDSSLMSEKPEEGTKRKTKMNFLIPRAISQPRAKPSEGGKIGNQAAASQSDTDSTASNSSGKGTSNSSQEIPRKMLSNSEFSKLFNK